MSVKTARNRWLAMLENPTSVTMTYGYDSKKENQDLSRQRNQLQGHLERLMGVIPECHGGMTDGPDTYVLVDDEVWERFIDAAADIRAALSQGESRSVGAGAYSVGSAMPKEPPGSGSPVESADEEGREEEHKALDPPEMSAEFWKKAERQTWRNLQSTHEALIDLQDKLAESDRESWKARHVYTPTGSKIEADNGETARKALNP